MTQPGKVWAAIAALAAMGALVAAAALTVAPPAFAASAQGRPEPIAKRAASARAQRFGLSYPPSAWRAACRRARAGGWRCAVGTGGQCSGAVSITGGARPRARRVDVWCFE